MARTAIERDRLDGAVRREQDGAAGRFIDAARLHADEPILDQIEPADTVVVTIFVQLSEQRRGRQRLAVDAHRIATLEADRNLGRLVRRVHRRDCALIDNRRSFLRRIFQYFSLGRRVQQVGVDREWRLAFLILGDGDLVVARELQQFLAAFEFPFTPRRDDLDAGFKRVIAKLEANLVVTLAGGAMTHRVGTDFARNVDLCLGDQRPRDRGAEQILAFIDGVGAEHRKHEVTHEFLAQIFDEDVFRLDAGAERFLARRSKLFALAEIGGEGHHLAARRGLQPLQDDRGIEPAGISQHDFLD